MLDLLTRPHVRRTGLAASHRQNASELRFDLGNQGHPGVIPDALSHCHVANCTDRIAVYTIETNRRFRGVCRSRYTRLPSSRSPVRRTAATNRAIPGWPCHTVSISVTLTMSLLAPDQEDGVRQRCRRASLFDRADVRSRANQVARGGSRSTKSSCERSLICAAVYVGVRQTYQRS